MVRSVSEWFPDRPPTRLEIVVMALSSFWFLFELFPFEETSWGWVAVGFVLTEIAIGPAGTTTTGKRVGQWFRDIGVTGRASAILLFAIVVWGTMFTVDIPIELVDSFLAGMWTALILYLLAHLAKAREIDGWRTGEIER